MRKVYGEGSKPNPNTIRLTESSERPHIESHQDSLSTTQKKRNKARRSSQRKKKKGRKSGIYSWEIDRVRELLNYWSIDARENSFIRARGRGYLRIRKRIKRKKGKLNEEISDLGMI